MANTDGLGPKGEISKMGKGRQPPPPRNMGRFMSGRGVAFNSNKMSIKKGNRGR
ncbi:MAG: hypothetical protein WCT46_06105 [Candidatus Gracilibacteria bacterium]